MAACITPERHTLSALAARGGGTRRGRARSPRGGLGIVELWSQAIGEIDAGRIVAAAISVFVAALRPLLGVVTGRLSRLRDRRSGEAGSDGPGLARRQPLRSQRQPGNRPARPFQGSTPEKLARSMRCFGRVPISHYRHRRSLVGFWRVVKLNLLPVKALPKSAFTAVDWRYEPSAHGPRRGSPLLRRIRAACAGSPTREPVASATIPAGGRAAVQEPASGRHSVGAGRLRSRGVGAVPCC